MYNVRNMLVMVQATMDCVGVFEYATSLAERLGSKLYVLDIIYNPFAYMGWNLPMPSMELDYEKLLMSVRDRLKALMAEERRSFPIESLLREGEPALQIAKVVEEKEIDLLVLPAHEETRIEHFLSGKMIEKVVRRMPCSVLLVKQNPEVLCVSGG